MCKYIGGEENEKYSLDVYECRECNFHIGLDSSYLEEVSSLSVSCPSCGRIIDTREGDMYFDNGGTPDYVIVPVFTFESTARRLESKNLKEKGRSISAGSIIQKAYTLVLESMEDKKAYKLPINWEEEMCALSGRKSA